MGQLDIKLFYKSLNKLLFNHVRRLILPYPCPPEYDAPVEEDSQATQGLGLHIKCLTPRDPYNDHSVWPELLLGGESSECPIYKRQGHLPSI